MPEDALYKDEEQRISRDFRAIVTDDRESVGRDEVYRDYHRHNTVHEGEQFFFSNAYGDAKDGEYSIKSTARQFAAKNAEPVLDETGSKSERKRKKKEHEAAKKRWEEARKRQARYDAAGDRIERAIIAERLRESASEDGVLSIPADYDEVMAADAAETADLAEKQARYSIYRTDPKYRKLLENRWIGISLATRTEAERNRLSPEERAETDDAESFYDEMFAGINTARDFMAAAHAATAGRDAESKKIYERLTRRLAEASNSYALNEREVKALQNIRREILSVPGADAETETACSAKADVQRRVRTILREEIRTIVSLIRTAQTSGALTPQDEKYLSLNGIDADVFRGIKTRREGHAADIERESEEESRRLEAAGRLRSEEERAAAEAERRRLAEAEAAGFKSELEDRFAEIFGRVSEVREALSRLEKGAGGAAAAVAARLADLKGEIETFLATKAYDGDLKEYFGGAAALAGEKQAELTGAVDTAFALYRLRVNAGLEALKDGETEARVDFLVDAEASEYCNERNRDAFERRIADEINHDAELRKVTEELNADLEKIRGVLHEADVSTDENDRKIDRAERIAYMKKLNACLATLEKQRAALRAVETEPGAEAQERKRDLHRSLFAKRTAAYSAAAAAVTENISALAFAKYKRSIRRRTNIERNLPKTAEAMRTRIARVSLSDDEMKNLSAHIAGGRLTEREIERLRENFAVFLTAKYRGNEDLDARLNRISADGFVREDDRAALSAAASYIITTEKKPELESALETASAAALEELRQELRAPNLLNTDSREAANNVGAKLGALALIARKNLIASDFAAFEADLREASESCLRGMKERLAGTYAYTEHAFLDRLLIDAELHPGVLRQLGAMKPEEQEALLKRIYGEKADALAAIDELLIGREDLDDLAIVLKAKRLKANAEPDSNEMYSMTAGHDAARLVRTCRGFIGDVKAKRPKDKALVDRMEQLERLDDKALIEALLRGKAAGNLPGAEFLYLNAYALILSAEKGAPVTAEEIQKTEAGKGCALEKIEAALKSKLASEEQYAKADNLLKRQMSVYDSERLGNRVMNFFGEFFGRDLSRERLGLRALNGLIELEDQSEARELQMGLARETFNTRMASGYDPASVNLLKRSVEDVFDGYIIKDDPGRQLMFAAGASLYKGKKARAEAARAEAAERRKAEKGSLKEQGRQRATAEDDRPGNQLLEEARSQRRDAGIEDAEEGASFAIALTAMRLLLHMDPADERLASREAWKDHREALKALNAKLPGVKNLLAITADKSSSSIPPDVKKIGDDFDNLLSSAITAGSSADFYARIKDIRDFFELYKLGERADAIVEADVCFTEQGREAELNRALGKSDDSKKSGQNSLLSDIRDRMRKHCGDIARNAKVRRLNEAAESDESGIESVFRARDERRIKYGIDHDSTEGATFALTVLAVQSLALYIMDLPDEQARRREMEACKKAFGLLRRRLGRHNNKNAFNLEAMTSEAGDRLEGSRVQRLRQDYKVLLDAFKHCETPQAFRETAEELHNFGLANRLRERAEAAIAMKPAEQSFDEKLDNAVGRKTDAKDDPLQRIRGNIENAYAKTIGAEALVAADDPGALLSRHLKSKLSVITKIAALDVFRSILPPMSFTEFSEALQNPQSEAFVLCAERLGAALADAEFEKRDALGGAAAGERYRPLAKGGEKGAASERSLSLARHFVSEFSKEITRGKQPKEWLNTNATGYQTEFSISQAQIRKDAGAAASAAHKSLLVGDMIERLTERVGKDSVLHISNYAGGSVGASVTVSEITGSVDLGLTLSNDLSVEHGVDKDGEDRWSVYIGGEIQARLAASIKADLGPVEVGAGATLNLSGASGMRLDFETADKCKGFLQYFLTGGHSPAESEAGPDAQAAYERQDGGKSAVYALGMSNRIVPIRSVAGSITLDASVSLGENALRTASGLIAELAEISEISSITAPAAEALGKIGASAAERVIGAAESAAGGVYRYFKPGALDFLNSAVEALPESAGKAFLKADLAARLRDLDEQAEKLISEKIRAGVEGLPEKISGKIEEKLREKIGAVLAAKGAEKEESDEESDARVKMLESAMQEAVIAAVNSVGGEAATPEEESKWVDVSLAASLSLGGKYETRRPAANKETVLTSAVCGASASASFAFAGASFAKSAEASFSASLERRFTDSKLTGVTMSRRYEIGGDTAAGDAKEILASFGLSNVTLERDMRGELNRYESVHMVVEAEMTQEGMEKYREAQKAKRTANSMMILSDRKNYVNTEIRIEAPVNSVSCERGLETEVDVSALGDGGALRLGFKIGASGEIIRCQRYNAVRRAAGGSAASA
ncbi:MAG: hypothetical protein LBB57_04785 [Clostridiales Family XIII bacterium]|jgi:hypothetical protein|nr:hypothetical protein [Clostridiales Family XIII bacterium]